MSDDSTNPPFGAKPRDYEVGYGKPPRQTRFKPGRSGNPHGRPRGRKALKTIVAGVLYEQVTIRTPAGTRKVSKIEALVHKLMNEALTGNGRSVQHLLRFTREAGLTAEVEAIEAATGPLTEEDQQILERYLGRPDEPS